MYNGKKILCIVPARGGSKGLPDKNIKLLHGKTLLGWTLIQAKHSSLIDKIVVSTDSDAISDVAKCHKVECIKRPEKYAQDSSPSYEAIVYTIDYLKNHKIDSMEFDIVLMLECTSPVRLMDDIDNMIMWLLDNDGYYDSCISIAPASDIEHPYLSKKEVDGYIVPFMDNCPVIHQRQELNEAYIIIGGMYLSKIDNYIKHKTFYQERLLGYKLNRWQKCDINDEIDFITTEAIMKKYYEQLI